MTEDSQPNVESYGDRPLEAFSGSISRQEAALEELPEATSSNYRGRAAYAPYPMIYMDRAEGVTLVDIDGNEYIDFHCGVSAIINGHRPEHQITRVQEQLDRGPYFATTVEAEYEAARLVNDLIPGSDRTKFLSTGTEAIMTAIRLARSYTGKDRILTFEGMYHGHSDEALVNVHPPVATLGSRLNATKVPDASGVPQSSMAMVDTLPWNDTEALETVLDRKGDQIAAVLTEAVMSNAGLLWPADGYLEDLRRLTRDHDVLLILDEVVTGFRIALGGAQAHFDIEPDLAIYGKALANGYPCAALTGTADVMDHIGPNPGQATVMGTFSGHPLMVAATQGNLEILQERGESGYDAFRDRGQRFVEGLRETLTDAGHDVFVPDFAGFTFVHFVDDDAETGTWREWRDIAGATHGKQYARFASELTGEGLFFPPKVGRINLTHAHTDEHIDEALETVKNVAERL